MDFIVQHLDYVFYSLAGICLVIELALLGMSGPLLFVALGCFVTGLLISLGVVQEVGTAAVVAAVCSAAAAALLWRPFKALQNRPPALQTSSDMVGRILPVTARITQQDGRVAYSGTIWLARLDASHHEPADEGDRVEVTSVDGTLLLVRPHSKS